QGAFPANGIGIRADGGPSLTYNFPLDLALDPSAYRDAAVTNLYFTDNYNHDVLYKYGFDEAAGNFQVTNYTGQGQGGDPVFAVEAFGADTGSYDNAFMYTPPDGQSPTQAMFLWDLTNPQRDGSLDAEVFLHELNHGTSGRLVGGP